MPEQEATPPTNAETPTEEAPTTLETPTLDVDAATNDLPLEQTPSSEKELSMDAFDNPPEVAAKTPAQLAEEAAQAEEQPPMEPQKTPTPEPVKIPGKKEFVPRDYSALTDQQAAMARRMSNEAFNSYKATVIENNKLKDELGQLKAQPLAPDQLPSHYYEHPEAYTLSKEYQSTVKEFQEMQLEAGHWERQLIAIESGKDWQNLTYDKERGYALGEVQKGSPEAKVQIMRWLNNANSLMHGASQKIGSLQTQFKTQHQGLVQRVNARADELFPMFKDPKGPWQKSYEQAMEIAKKDGVGDNILAPLLAKMYVYTVWQGEELKKLRKAETVKKQLVNGAAKASPTASTFSGGTPKGDRVLDMEAFNDSQ